MNTSVCCNTKSDTSLNKAVIVRICRHMATDRVSVISRDREIMAIQLAHSCQVAMPVYAIFKNGFVYGHARGRTLEYEDLFKPNIAK